MEPRTLTYTVWNVSRTKHGAKSWHPVTFTFENSGPEDIQEIKVHSFLFVINIKWIFILWVITGCFFLGIEYKPCQLRVWITNRMVYSRLKTCPVLSLCKKIHQRSSYAPCEWSTNRIIKKRSLISYNSTTGSVSFKVKLKNAKFRSSKREYRVGNAIDILDITNEVNLCLALKGFYFFFFDVKQSFYYSSLRWTFFYLIVLFSPGAAVIVGTALILAGGNICFWTSLSI